MTVRPSVAVTDVTFAFEIDVIAPALTKCEIVVQYNTFSNHWLYRRGVLECCFLSVWLFSKFDTQIQYEREFRSSALN